MGEGGSPPWFLHPLATPLRGQKKPHPTCLGLTVRQPFNNITTTKPKETTQAAGWLVGSSASCTYSHWHTGVYIQQIWVNSNRLKNDTRTTNKTLRCSPQGYLLQFSTAGNIARSPNNTVSPHKSDKMVLCIPQITNLSRLKFNCRLLSKNKHARLCKNLACKTCLARARDMSLFLHDSCTILHISCKKWCKILL